jgi:hypothetical protein
MCQLLTSHADNGNLGPSIHLAGTHHLQAGEWRGGDVCSGCWLQLMATCQPPPVASRQAAQVWLAGVPPAVLSLPKPAVPPGYTLVLPLGGGQRQPPPATTGPAHFAANRAI